MKASVKLRRDQEGRVQKKPIVKAKLPFDFLGFPVHACLKVCGHIQELAIRLSCAQQEAGPSLEVSYRPHEQDRPFTLSLKTGFSPWPSSPASALTMAAEFSLSRLSNPAFLLKVKPQLGDFSFSHAFRSEIRSSSGATMSPSSDDRRHVGDGSSSDMGFTNAFARYASRLHLSDNASSSWHDTATNESFDAGQHTRYDAAGTANLVSFDSTPYASEKTGYARLDFAKFSSELTTPLQIFAEEKRFQEVGQHRSASADWGPSRDNSSRNLVFTQRSSRMDDDWVRVGDAVSQSTTSASSSTQQNRDNGHESVRRHSRHSHSTSSLAGWAVRGFCGGSHLRACTRLPISSEAHLKVRWSVGASCSSSRDCLLPILLLDKVSLEASPPSTGAHRTGVSLPFSNAPRSETLRENVTHLKQASILKKARDESMSEGGSDYAGSEGELKLGHELHTDNVNMKKTSFFNQFLHGKGLLD